MWSFDVADEVDLDSGLNAAMDARDLTHQEKEEKTWKSTQLVETLAELCAERAALVDYISYYESVWTARGWEDGMLGREKAGINLLDLKIWWAPYTMYSGSSSVPARPGVSRH